MGKELDLDDVAEQSDLAKRELRELRHALAFYKRRCDLLQIWQSAMRDPERTLVCDVLANGQTLPPSHANGRYGSMTPNA
jgi:hypothetical protein